MARKSSDPILSKLDILLNNVGDMSLKRRAKKIIEDIGLKDYDQILDLGCGDGYYLYLLTSLPAKNIILIGFDNDGEVLKNAEKNLGKKKVKLVFGSAEYIPFRNNSFKKVIMTEVLEHIDDDRKALKEVYRILKRGGTLFLTVPSYNFPFLWDPLNWVLQHTFGTHIHGSDFFAGIWARHLRLYRKRDLEKIIKQAGFKIEKVEELTYYCLPFNHYLVNLVARFLYDMKPSPNLSDPISKFKNSKKPFPIRLAFFLINFFDRLNEVFPGKNGLNIYIKAKK